MAFWKFSLILLIFVVAIVFMFWQLFFQSSPKKVVLFLCFHNTFRSQMAEAYFNKFAKDKNLNWQAKSAGFLEADKVNEKAVILMAEEGIDISNKKPKLINEEMLNEADKIIVVCKECEEMGYCLALPKDKEIEYWRFENPAQMELEKGREIRNLIKEKIFVLIETLE